MHWMREDREHPISVQLMKPPATAFQACTIYNMLWPTHLSNCQLLLFCLLLWCIKIRSIFVFYLFFYFFATCSYKRIALRNLLLFGPDLFPFPTHPFFFSLRSCIVVSSSWAVGASRVSHKHNRQAHFSQVDFPAILQDVMTNCGCVTDPRHTRVLALEHGCNHERCVCFPCECVRRSVCAEVCASTISLQTMGNNVPMYIFILLAYHVESVHRLLTLQ